MHTLKELFLKGKTFKTLQQHNLCLVCDLRALSGNTSQITTIAGSISGISFERLSAFVCAAEACLEGSPPPVIDHCEASNPCISLYGEDSLKEQCNKDCMTGKMCVTETIDSMFDQTKEILGENGFVYHNALILMTLANSSETVVKDIEKVLCSSLQVVEAQCAPIDEAGEKSGKRHLPKDQHGGNRVRKLKDDVMIKKQVSSKVQPPSGTKVMPI
eukprot:jgi/Psemu1/6822/gm1.6822_g